MRKPVLTIFYQFDPWMPTIGGIQTLIRSFIKYASPEFKVRLVGISSSPDRSIGKWNVMELHDKEVLFLPLFYLPNDNVRQPIPTTLRYAAALMRRRLDSDFMHFHRLESSLATLSWAGHKTLFVHNDIQQQMQTQRSGAILWSRFPQAYSFLEKFLIQQFNQILSCNSSTTAVYQKSYPSLAPRIHSIPNSVDQDQFYPLTPMNRNQQRLQFAEEKGLPSNTRFILFAGRLHPQKNPLLLVQSIAVLNQPNVHLLIAGAGELESAVQTEIQRLQLTAQISMLGALNSTELVQLYQLADLFVLTSLYEGFPVSVLEALACGTPVVTTNCGETPRLLTASSGVVCRAETPEAVAEALRQVLLHPEQFPAQACLQTADPYSAEAVVSQIYDDMLSTWQERILATL